MAGVDPAKMISISKRCSFFIVRPPSSVEGPVIYGKIDDYTYGLPPPIGECLRNPTGMEVERIGAERATRPVLA